MSSCVAFNSGMVRLPFHDAFGKGTTPNGCLDPAETDHNGLPSVRAVVDPVCTKHSSYLSRADCWVLAGNVAIAAAGGQVIPFRFGRVDCDDESLYSDKGLLPSAKPGGNPWTHVSSIFHDRGGLSVREIVALLGAHSLGRPSSDANSNSGFSALPWVAGPQNNLQNPGGDTLTTKYYSSIVGIPWTKSTTKTGEWLHNRPNDESPDALMLDTDMALAIDVSSCDAKQGNIAFGGGQTPPNNAGGCRFNDLPYAELQRYAKSGMEDVWKAEFSVAVQKMTEMGYSSWVEGGSISATTLCEVTSTSSTKTCTSVSPTPPTPTSPTPVQPTPPSPTTPTPTPSVQVSMKFSAAALPTESDKTLLKNQIAIALNAAANTEITDFVVLSTQTSRRRRLLAVYSWAVSFKVSTTATTPASVTSALSSQTFISAVSTAVGATLDTTSLSVVASSSPGPAPSSSPASEKLSTGAIIGIAVGAAGLVVIVALVLFLKLHSSGAATSTDVEERKTEPVKASMEPANVPKYIKVKGRML